MNIEIEYTITFQKTTGKPATFYRHQIFEHDAIASAKHGFQWAYGYWPGDPIKVEKI